MFGVGRGGNDCMVNAGTVQGSGAPSSLDVSFASVVHFSRSMTVTVPVDMKDTECDTNPLNVYELC